MERRYDLDWLRVLAFGVLIFYHIGMLYVADWGFHYKSQYQSEVLQNLMLLVNRWRLPLLFFISGVACHYLLNKYSLVNFVRTRTWRLLLPLLFGVLVIVPPQLYVEMTAKGDLHTGYWEFYKAFFDLDNPLFADYQSGILPHIDVNHLWYLRELWWFSLLLVVIHPLIKWLKVDNLLNFVSDKMGFVGVLLVPVVCISIASVFAFPDSEEGMRIARGFSFFVLGYFIGQRENWWLEIRQSRRLSLILSIGSYIGLLCYYHFVWLVRTEPLVGGYAALEATLLLANRWVWVLAILGYSFAYLNKPSVLLRYLCGAVYPSYLLHQSILIVVAFCLSPLMLGGGFEAFWVIVATVSICWLGYEVIRRIGLLQPFFGVSIKRDINQKSIFRTSLSIFGWGLIIPFGYLILV